MARTRIGINAFILGCFTALAIAGAAACDKTARGIKQDADQAAVILDVAEGTVKSRCFRGREALAAILRAPDRPVTGSSEPQGAS